MLFLKSHAIFFVMYLVTTYTVNARPINKQVDPKHLSEEDKPTSLFNHQGNASTVNSSNIDESNPSEVQKAVCTVTAGDVKASAEAVTTKTLKGVCGSAEMLSAFRSLENFLNKELQDIRELLILLQQKKLAVDDVHGHNISESSKATSNSTSSSIKLQPIPLENKYSLKEPIKNNNLNSKLKVLQTKDISNNKFGNIGATVREHEISMFNNTLLTDRDIKIFTYYWRMENFTARIVNSVVVESPIFSIKGSAFKIKAYFQHLHRDFLFLQLEGVSSSQVGFANSIILDTGGIFKEIDGNNFKYKISILDQNKPRAKDLVSQELDSHEKGFLIPNSALLDTSFVKEDALLIQIFLYL